MIYAFMFPFVGGTLAFAVLSLFFREKAPLGSIANIYHAGIITLTIGSLLQGVLDIYGTSNILIIIYWFLGCALTAIGALLYFLVQNKKPARNSYRR